MNVQISFTIFSFKIPFPAVTICPESKFSKEKFDFIQILQSFIHEPENATDDDLLNILSLHQICDGLISKRLDHMVIKFQNITGWDVAARLQGFSESLVEFDKVCFASMCFGQSLLSTVITEEGLCYTFNMLRYQEIYESTFDYMTTPDHEILSNWTIFGYKTSDLEVYPYRSLGRGINAGLRLKLSMKVDDLDYTCKESTSGFRLVLHTPGETPRPSAHFYRIPFNSKTLVAVNPKVMTTSNDLGDYDPEKRQCFFEGEKKLKFFKMYTESNCQLECFTSI